METEIKARNGGQFDAANARLTEACGACHRNMDHKMIVIQVPRGAGFPDRNVALPKQWRYGLIVRFSTFS
ncbi:MAG: hypothetical protein JSR91_21605 [Proteobacteria bacterium]|nr:hypothetical protein [Pseudomonadota bacterium]